MNALQIVKKFFPRVTKVSDADEDAFVEVLDKDDRNSRRKDHNGCALAVACKRTFNADGVVVSISTLYIVKKGRAVRYRLPEGARREVMSFDRGSGFSTGTYELHRVSKSARLGAQRGTPNRKGGHISNPRFQHYTTGIREVLSGKKRA